jgi:hypothetical protein
MPEVFISYAREDRVQAEQLHRDLRSEGFDAWIDSQDLLAGSNWSTEIRRAIRASQYFVLLLSEKCMTKRGFVHREIREALDVVREMPESHVFLIPARLEPCEVTHEDLGRLQWVDLFPDWDQGVAKITRTLSRRNLDTAQSVQKLQESNPTARLRGDTISLPGRKSQPLAMIATTREAVYEMAKRLAARDVSRLFNMIKEERGTMIPAGTLVEVVEWNDYRELKLARIKLLEGDLKGYMVWTISQCLP